MKIIELSKKSDNDLWNKFFDIPVEVYKGDKNWIIEDRKQLKEQIFELLGGPRYQCWPMILEDNDMPIARGVAILPPESKGVGWIGYFEGLEKYKKEMNELFRALEDKLLVNKVKKVIFPKIDNMQAGLQISKFNIPPSIFTSYNPKYYKKIIKKANYKLSQKLVTFYFNKKIAKYVKSKDNVKLRTFNDKDIENEIKLFHKFQIDVFISHEGYIPRTLEEEGKLINRLIPFMDKDLIIIAEDDNKKIIGSLVCLPDYNQKIFEGKIDKARIVSIGVHSDYLRQGIGKQMGNLLMKTLIDKDYKEAEASWILKKNVPPQFLAKIFGAKKGRTFGIFEKYI
ncbi:MAG: GNAT family N-acetyltransferase [Candidatus Kerfeldbacteria bacterium]